MNKFEKQLNKTVTGMKLSVTEKRELRARVVSYMEYHPRREKVAVEKAQAYLESQPYRILSFHNRFLQAFVGAAAVLVLIVVPTVAERSVPGDVLYPIKVRINEEVRGSLTFSATEKIEWETERLERRISEVRLLASEGRLTDETETQAVAAVKEHAEAAQDEIKKLKETDVDSATLAELEFESALEVQSVVLDAEQLDAATADATDELAVVVKAAQAATEAGKSTTTPSYEKITARLEQQTTRAYELFASLTDVVTPEQRTEVERRLSDIERKINTGVSRYEADGTVPLALLEALAGTQKLISFMTDIDVRTSVPLDSLVPVSLTDEEKQRYVNEQTAAGNALLTRIEEVLTDENATESLIGKVQVAKQTIEVLLATIENATQESSLDAQYIAAEEIAILYEDVTLLINQEIDSDDEIPADVEDAATTTDAVGSAIGTSTETATDTATSSGATTTVDTL